MIDIKLIEIMKQSLVINPFLEKDEIKAIKKNANTEKKNILYADDGGSYSSVIFKENMAYKYTLLEDVEEYDVNEIVESANGLDYLFLNNYSDGEVLNEIKNENFFPTLHHWENVNNFLDISVVDYVKGIPLSSELNDSELIEFRDWLINMVKWTLDNGWVPIDVKPRNILRTNEGFCMIDLGLFQRIDTFIDAIEAEGEYSGSGVSALYELIGKDGINIVSCCINACTSKIQQKWTIKRFQNIA